MSKIPPSLRAKWKSITNHIRLAAASLPAEPGTYKEVFDYLDHNELLLAFDTLESIVLNSGGEEDEIRASSEFWRHMTHAARLMIN